MALIQWDETFELGIPELDHELRELVDLINLLSSRLSEDASELEICEILADLQVAATVHFALEESVMRDHGYNGIAAHKAEHELLLDRILDVMDGRRLGTYQPCESDRAHQLRDWLVAHIHSADARFRHALRAASGR